MRPLTWTLKEVESGRTTQTVMHTCSGKLGIVKIVCYIRSDMYTASSQTRSYYILHKAPTCSTLSYTSHTMKQSNLIKREQTGQSLQSTSYIIKSKHHLAQWCSTFFPPRNSFTLNVFGEPP
jgi:hypothetical protein